MSQNPASASHPALHELNPTGRFTTRVDSYRRARPGYPAAAIDAILAGLGDPARLTVADVGAGTGISARLVADRGPKVLAIEPNDAMRGAIEPHPRIEPRPGVAEATGLPAQSVDIVVAAQAFHWFRPAETLTEFLRILKPKGRLAVMWNQRDLSDALTAAYSDAVSEASGRTPEDKWHIRPEELVSTPGFSVPWEQTFTYEHELDERGLVDRALSASYVPTSGPKYERLLEDLRSMFKRFAYAASTVRMKYTTIVYLSEPEA